VFGLNVLENMFVLYRYEYNIQSRKSMFFWLTFVQISILQSTVQLNLSIPAILDNNSMDGLDKWSDC